PQSVPLRLSVNGRYVNRTPLHWAILPFTNRFRHEVCKPPVVILVGKRRLPCHTLNRQRQIVVSTPALCRVPERDADTDLTHAAGAGVVSPIVALAHSGSRKSCA